MVPTFTSVRSRFLTAAQGRYRRRPGNFRWQFSGRRFGLSRKLPPIQTRFRGGCHGPTRAVSWQRRPVSPRAHAEMQAPVHQSPCPTPRLKKAIGKVPDIEFSDSRQFSIPRGRFLYSFKLVFGSLLGPVRHGPSVVFRTEPQRVSPPAPARSPGGIGEDHWSCL